MTVNKLVSLKRIFIIGFERKVFSMLALYIVYLSMGAFLFLLLEKSNEEYTRNLTLSSSHLIKNMVKTLRTKGFTDEDIAFTFDLKHKEWLQENAKEAFAWQHIFGDKFLFSMILITTIGYGNIAPKTVVGKVACITYTLIGLPLNMTFMRLLNLIFRSALRNSFHTARQIQNSKFLIIASGFLYFAVFTVLLIFIPAAVYSAVEGWSYQKSVYFCFISLTTIGLGDYVAGVSAKRSSSMFYAFYVSAIFFCLLVGLAFISMCLNLLSYLLGELILDKLDCNYRKRVRAKKQMKGIYKCVAELSWQLAKYTPKDFTNWKQIEDFKDQCVENPHDITVQNLRDIYAVIEELQQKAISEKEQIQKDENAADDPEPKNPSGSKVGSPKTNKTSNSKSPSGAKKPNKSDDKKPNDSNEIEPKKSISEAIDEEVLSLSKNKRSE